MEKIEIMFWASLILVPIFPLIGTLVPKVPIDFRLVFFLSTIGTVVYELAGFDYHHKENNFTLILLPSFASIFLSLFLGALVSVVLLIRQIKDKEKGYVSFITVFLSVSLMICVMLNVFFIKITLGFDN
jgi:type III secretory pathway component EscS